MSNIQSDPTGASQAMVIIHGAGNWPIDYSKPMVDAIKSMISAPAAQQLERIEVNFSDVIASSAAQAMRATTQATQNKFKNMMVNDHLQATMSTLAPDQIVRKLIGGAPQIAALGVAVLFPWSDLVLNALSQVIAGKSLAQVQSEVIAGIGPTIEDVCVYLYANSVLQGAFRQRLVDKLHEAQKFDEVILVSHSLGTVIAFDVLNAWQEATPKIPVWFTMGCPLAKVLRLDSGRQPQLKCPNVDRWFNVYNTHDLVANPLSPIFSRPGYSVYDIFVDVKDPTKTDPVSAHDYFTNNNALKVLADAIAAF